MQQYRVAVIGAGPAGIMAAVQAGTKGGPTLLLEKNNGLGSKLLITGGGRCNLANLTDLPELVNAYHNGPFLHNVFAQFQRPELTAFFEENGFDLTVEEDQSVFPASQSARDVVDFLEAQLKGARVQVWLKNPVRDIRKKDPLFEITSADGLIAAEKIILATGGKSYPQTGSTGDGYRLAAAFGHTVLKPKPALCGIVLQEKWLKNWQGIALPGVSVKLKQENKLLGSEYGEIIFTHFGISGPAVLNLSRVLTDVENKKSTRLLIDFTPDLSAEDLQSWLTAEFSRHGKTTLRNILGKRMPAAIAEQIVLSSRIPEPKTAGHITTEERRRLVDLVRNFPLAVDGLPPIDGAMVTRGGISVKEINPKTMESRIIPGLFFAGEIIDVDGKTGGFNLQAAFSTGFVAGSHA